jgi:outer membrane protein
MPGRAKLIHRLLHTEMNAPRIANPCRPGPLPLKIALFYLLSLATPYSFAANDLLTALEAAQAKDPFFRESEAKALSVAEGIPQAKAALWMPTLSFTAGATRVRQEINSAFEFGANGNIAYTAKEYRINLSQPVYHYDRFIALAQADKRLQQAQLEVLAARQDLMIRVAERYFEVLAAEDNVEFARAEKDSLRSQLDQAQQRFDVGLIAITDVQEAQAGHDRALASEISAQNALENAREALREVTEFYSDQLSTLGDGMPLAIPEPLDIEAWTQTALLNNIQLKASEIAATIAHDEIRRQYAQHLPSLDIVGGHGYNQQGGRFGASEVTQGDIGVQLNVPIFEGGRTLSRTRQSEHDHSAAIERLEQSKRAVHRQTREAYLGVVTRISAVNALRQAVVSSQTALESTQAGFEVGTRTAVDVVDAERSLFQSKRDYARARYDYILDTLRLKRAAGSLAPEDMATANSWLSDASVNTGSQKSSTAQ